MFNTKSEEKAPGFGIELSLTRKQISGSPNQLKYGTTQSSIV